MTVDTLASSVFSLSRSCCFSLRFFMIPFPSNFFPKAPASESGRYNLFNSLRRCRNGGFRFRQVDPDRWTHGGRERDLLDVLAFRRSRLRFDDSGDEGMGVFGDVRRFKLDFVNWAVHDAGLVYAE